MLCILTVNSLEPFFFFFFLIHLVLASFLGTLLRYNEQSKQQGMELSPHSDSEKTPPPWQEFKHGGGVGRRKKEANCSTSSLQF